MLIRSTPLSGPNNITGGHVRLSVGRLHQCVCLSTKSFSDFNEIWYIDRGRPLMDDSMLYDPIEGQGQGHRASEVPINCTFLGLSPPPFTTGAGK